MSKITTIEALDALPIGRVVLDRHGEVWQHMDDTERLDAEGNRLPKVWASPAWTEDRTAREMFEGLGRRSESRYGRDLGPFTLLVPEPEDEPQDSRPVADVTNPCLCRGSADGGHTRVQIRTTSGAHSVMACPADTSNEEAYRIAILIDAAFDPRGKGITLTGGTPRDLGDLLVAAGYTQALVPTGKISV